MLRKLRVGVVVGAVLLLAVIVGFVWYGRLAAFKFRLALPKKLGLNISQASHVVTLSRSVKGKTVFTIHAADQVQQTNGLVELHDVGIELFGRDGGRSDKISGQDFLFDQKKGVMTGVGAVLIDLAAPAGKDGGTVEGKTVHVKTSGVTFDQNAQTAVTDQGIEFEAGGMTGTAVGANYDAKSGMVELKSAVHVSGLQGGQPVMVTAGWAELERQQNVVLMMGAKYTVVGNGGGESAAADRAQVHITADGTPREIDGQGHVVLVGANRGTMTGQEMQLLLTEAGKPRAGRIWGGVLYQETDGQRRANGAAQQVQVAFDGAGNPAHAVAEGGVTFDQQAPAGARALRAAKVEMGFGAAGKGKARLREAEGIGGAQVRMAGVTSKGRTLTEVSGDELKAQFVTVAGKDQITTLDGTGHTSVHQVGADGADEMSRGETLAVSFKPGMSGKGAADQIERAVQRGGVTIVRMAPAKVAAGKKEDGPAVEHATAKEALYEADGEKLTLSGGAQVTDATSVLLADSVQMLRESGDATADGNVRVSYLAADGKGEPLHVTAARAMEKKAAGMADFFGTAGRDARMWQEGSQVQAPVLSFSQNGKDVGSRKLVAHGEMSGDAPFVRAVLVSAAPSDETAKGKEAGAGSGGPVRITGHVMTYSEAARTVEFLGRVKVVGQDGTMNSNEGTAYLAGPTAAGETAAVAGAGLMGGRVERVVADGAVRIEQPGRVGTGERLVYTAADRLFVLTGTVSSPPKVVDEAQGTTMGAALRFVSGEERVTVVGGDGGGKVLSTTKVRPRR